MATLLSLFFGVFGVCLGAVLSHIFTVQRADREYRLRKLEEIAVKVLVVQRKDFSTYNLCSTYCNEKLTPEMFNELLSERKNNSGDVIDEIHATSSILFETLEGRFAEWMKVRDACARTVISIIASKEKMRLEALGKALDAGFKMQDQLSKEFSNAVVSLDSDIRMTGVL